MFSSDLTTSLTQGALYEIIEINFLFSENDFLNIKIYNLLADCTLLFCQFEIDKDVSLSHLEKAITLCEFSLEYLFGYNLLKLLTNLGVMYGFAAELTHQVEFFDSAKNSFSDSLELLKISDVFDEYYATGEGFEFNKEYSDHLAHVHQFHNLRNLGDCHFKSSFLNTSVKNKAVALSSALEVYEQTLQMYWLILRLVKPEYGFNQNSLKPEEVEIRIDMTKKELAKISD